MQNFYQSNQTSKGVLFEFCGIQSLMVASGILWHLVANAIVDNSYF